MNKFWTSHEQVVNNYLNFLLSFVGGWWVDGWVVPILLELRLGLSLAKGDNHENISHWCHYKLIAYMNTDCNMSPLIPIWQQNNIQTILWSPPYSNQFYQFYFIMLLHWWVLLWEVEIVCITLFKILFDWFGFDYLCGQLVILGCGSGVN